VKNALKVGWVERSGPQHRESGSTAFHPTYKKNGEGIDIRNPVFWKNRVSGLVFLGYGALFPKKSDRLFQFF
jgi:hypothetical protein